MEILITIGGIIAACLAIYAGYLQIRGVEINTSLNETKLESDQTHKIKSIQYRDSRITYKHIYRKRDKAIFFCSGFGLSHNDYENHYSLYEEYDLVFFTNYGFDGSIADTAKVDSFDDLCRIFASFINEISKDKKYLSIDLVGFSLSADQIILCIENELIEANIERIFLLDPNLSNSTLFVSSFLSKAGSGISINDLNKLHSASSFSTINKWVNFHEYFVKILKKYPDDKISYLSMLAKDICRIYSNSQMQFTINRINSIPAEILVYMIISNDIKLDLWSELHNGLDERIFLSHEIHRDHFDLIKDTEVLEKRI